ncbi:MAG: hypothetical protein ACXW5U_26870 [Thermoanaerobaculia bacterium]
MKVITGKVVDGEIHLKTDLKEGTPIAVIAAEDDSGFRLTAEDEDELFAALQDVDRGNHEDGHELLRELKALSR